MSKKLSETLEIPAETQPVANPLTGSAYRDLVAIEEEDWLTKEAHEYGANKAARVRIENAVNNSNEDSPEKDKLLATVATPRFVSYEPGDSALFVDPEDLAAAFPEVYSKFHEINGQYHDLDSILRKWSSPGLREELKAHELRLLTKSKVYQTLLGTELELSPNQLFPEIENYRLQIRKRITILLVLNAIFALLIAIGVNDFIANLWTTSIGVLDILALAEVLLNANKRYALRRRPISPQAKKIYDLAMEIQGLKDSAEPPELIGWKAIILKQEIIQLNVQWKIRQTRLAAEALAKDANQLQKLTPPSEPSENLRVKLNNRIASVDQTAGTLALTIEDEEDGPSSQQARRTR